MIPNSPDFEILEGIWAAEEREYPIEVGDIRVMTYSCHAEHDDHFVNIPEELEPEDKLIVSDQPYPNTTVVICSFWGRQFRVSKRWLRKHTVDVDFPSRD